ncbi:MAG: pyridoxal phosphate-dependent aminotransferase [Oscillospiraceae bacterium]|nr:pyridoxal phosphate-dependent aminotransferase [Oscillospiraceae bacterium]
MNRIGKSTKLNNVAYDVRGPVFDEASLMEANGEKILKLNIGNPATFGFHAPDDIVAGMADHLSAADGYSDSKGLLVAREAIAAYCEKRGIRGVTPDDVYTGNGVSDLIVLSMQGLLDAGDEILMPSPDYPLWTAAATLAGGTVRHYRCDEQSSWYPDVDDIRSKISDKTKGIVVINPNNPTGAVYPREILEGIAALAKEHNLIVFADEIYERLTMDGAEAIPFASISDDVFVVTLSGLSKSHRAAGFRVGWMTLSGKRDNVRGYIEGINILSSMRICSNVPAQMIIAPALAEEKEDEDLKPGGRIYERRRIVCEELSGIDGLSFVRPAAAFYIFPKVDVKRFHIEDDEEFALDLLRKKKILITRGMGFHWPEPDHFRIVYLPREDILRSACRGIADYLHERENR